MLACPMATRALKSAPCRHYEPLIECPDCVSDHAPGPDWVDCETCHNTGLVCPTCNAPAEPCPECGRPLKPGHGLDYCFICGLKPHHADDCKQVRYAHA